jgi:hypothetical protein
MTSIQPRSQPRSICALALALLPAALTAQDVIPDEPSCARCSLSVSEIVTLADDPRAHMPGPPLRVIVDGNGRYWITYPGGAVIPLVYGPDGRFLRELGPRGDGPGEWQAPAAVLPLPGDSMLVYDGRRGTLSVLRPDLTLARTIRESMSYFALTVLHWPDIVFGKTPGTVGAPGSVPVWTPGRFSMLGLRGETPRVTNSFGGGLDPGIAHASTSSVWTWDYHPYRIEEWHYNGTRTRAFERRLSWFPEGERPSSQRGQMPPAHLQSVQQDEQGRLWVAVNEPIAVWPAGEANHYTREMERYYRTRLEVIDPTARRLIASVPLEGWAVSLLPGRRAAMYGTTQGTPYVRIVQLGLTP